MKPTKTYISEKALKLFNEYGFVNVRLQHIADASFVSIGHLAYHFKNKNAIVAQLYNELQREQSKLMNEYKTILLFKSVNEMLVSQYLLQEKYIFFYLDILEIIRAYPDIGEKHKKQIELQQYQYTLMLQFSSARGALRSLSAEESKSLSWLLQTTADKYFHSCKIQAEAPSSAKLEQVIWMILQPYFTSMGLLEYRQLQSEKLGIIN